MLNYQSLLTSQYQTSPNLLSWLALASSPLDDICTCLATFLARTDIDSATNGQLDVLGQILGQSRTVGFQPTGGVSPVLDDTTYRTLLKARIAQNEWDGTMDGMQAAWQTIFPGGRISITDAQNMTATVIVAGVLTSILQDLISNGYIVPRPQAVLYTYTFSTLPIFGFGQDGTYIGGFDHGHWS